MNKKIIGFQVIVGPNCKHNFLFVCFFGFWDCVSLCSPLFLEFCFIDQTLLDSQKSICLCLRSTAIKGVPNLLVLFMLCWGVVGVQTHPINDSRPSGAKQGWPRRPGRRWIDTKLAHHSVGHQYPLWFSRSLTSLPRSAANSTRWPRTGPFSSALRTL